MRVAYPRVTRRKDADGWCSSCKRSVARYWVDVWMPTIHANGRREMFRFCVPCAEFLSGMTALPMNKECRRRVPVVSTQCTVKRYAPPEPTGNDCVFKHTPAGGTPRVAFHTSAGMSIICEPCLLQIQERAR